MKELGPGLAQASLPAARADPKPFLSGTQLAPGGTGTLWSAHHTRLCRSLLLRGPPTIRSWENLLFVKAWVDRRCPPTDCLWEEWCQCLSLACADPPPAFTHLFWAPGGQSV